MTKGEEEDVETDELAEEGEEELEEHGLQECGKPARNAGGGIASRIHWRPCSRGSLASSEPSSPVSEACKQALSNQPTVAWRPWSCL